MTPSGGWLGRLQRDADQRRRRIETAHRANIVDSFKTEFKLQQAEGRDQQAAIKAGEVSGWEGMGTWVHVLLCFLTAGLWLPVLVWVLLRDRRRYRATSVGRNDKARRVEARAQLKARQDARVRGR